METFVEAEERAIFFLRIGAMVDAAMWSKTLATMKLRLDRQGEDAGIINKIPNTPEVLSTLESLVMSIEDGENPARVAYRLELLWSHYIRCTSAEMRARSHARIRERDEKRGRYIGAG